MKINGNFILILLIIICALVVGFGIINLETIRAEEDNELGYVQKVEFDCKNLTDEVFTLYEGNSLYYRRKNTCNLQKAIDDASKNGGGTVVLPKGTYYFAPHAVNNRGVEAFVIKCRDNVSLIGAGMDEINGTVLKTFGTITNNGGEVLATDMFYFNDYADSGTSSPKYLVNADFSNFVIDGEEAYTKDNKIYYNSAGKGFMINLFQDCDWDHVMVKNTFGTGFGMDCPINSTIKNCVAIGNGAGAYYGSNTNSIKGNMADAMGASGFGIGTGYSDDENILIENCVAIGNGKYGFFFEHQNRFSKSYTATKSKGFKVINSTSVANMYNYGGERGYDVTYENCKSYISTNDYPNNMGLSNLNPLNSTNLLAFNLGTNTRRITFINSSVDFDYSSIGTSSSNYSAIKWALNHGTLHAGINENFDINKETSRARAITFLWRYAGFPGIVLQNKETVVTGFEDIDNNISTYKYYVDAIKWAKDNGINNGVSTDIFEPDNNMKLVDFLVSLWRYEGEPVSTCAGIGCNISSSKYYAKAIYWAYENNIITYSELTNIINDGNINITDGVLINILYKNDQLKPQITSSKYLIDRYQNYIYTKSNINSNAILQDLDVSTGTKEIRNNQLLIKNNDEVVETFDIVNISSSDYILTNNYIYTGIDSFDSDKIIVSKGSKTLNNNILKVQYQGITLDELAIVNMESSGLTMNTSKNYLKVSNDNTVSWLTSKILPSIDSSVVDTNDNNLLDNSSLRTGSKLKIQLDDEIISHTLVVPGDVTGDGKVNVTDISRLFRTVKGTSTLEGCYREAGNVAGTTDVLNVTDISKLYRYVKKDIDSLE